MKKLYFIGALVVSLGIGYFIGCGDEIYSTDGALRYVYEVSEANVTGAGGVVKVPVLHVGQEGSGGGDMAMVTAYGSGRAQNSHWQMLIDVELSEGQVKIDANEYPSYYYRVVVIY